MTLRVLLTICLGLALASPVRAENTAILSVFQEVTGAWQYEALQQLEDMGLSPGLSVERPFSGRLLTRYEFAIATQRCYRDGFVPMPTPTDPTRKALFEAIVKKYQAEPLRVENLDAMQRLLTEFEPELKMLGWERNSSPPPAQPRTDGGTSRAKSRIPPRPSRETRNEKLGRMEARRDWDRGAVSFCHAGCQPLDYLDSLLGSPIRSAGVQSSAFGEEMLAYRDEIYRLTLERGWPPNSVRRVQR